MNRNSKNKVKNGDFTNVAFVKVKSMILCMRVHAYQRRININMSEKISQFRENTAEAIYS